MSTIINYVDEQGFDDGPHWARPMLPVQGKGGCLDYVMDNGRIIRKFSLKDGGTCQNDRNRYANDMQNCPERAFLSYEGSKDKRPHNTLTRAKFNFNLQPGPKITSPWMVFAQYNCAPPAGVAWKSPPVSFGAIGLGGQEFFLIVARWETGKKEFYIPIERKQLLIQMDFVDGRGGTGWLEVSIDNQTVQYEGPLGYPDHDMPYFAHGLYRSPIHTVNEDLLVHYENITEGVV